MSLSPNDQATVLAFVMCFHVGGDWACIAGFNQIQPACRPMFAPTSFNALNYSY
jgi:hypothetical protein